MVGKEDRKLQGKVLGIEKAGEKFVDEEGNEWEKCLFTVELARFSKRTPKEKIGSLIKGKRVKLVRWCCFDWHYKIGTTKTLEPDETEAVVKGTPTKTVYW